MAVITSCKYLLCVALWVACLVNCVSLTQGQVDCSGDDLDQCEVGYYCESDYRCKKCAPCENFQPASPCAKSLLDCGACLDGYEFLSIGKCAVQANNGSVGTILLLVVTGCSTVILLILIITAALRYLRKKRTKTFACSNRYGLEVGVVRNVATAPTAPEYLPPPPPYTSHSPQPAFNSIDNASSEPLLKSQISAPECQIEEHQMARPYSQYVCLPPGLRSFAGEDESFNGNEGVEEDFHNENITNSNEAPTSGRPSGRQRVSGALLPALPADHQTDSLSLRDLTISTQAQESDIISCTESVAAGLSAPQCARSRPPSPAHARDAGGAGAQQVIVQFISNVSPILNLQGNNTRR